jgi:hypothetical protein
MLKIKYTEAPLMMHSYDDDMDAIIALCSPVLFCSWLDRDVFVFGEIISLN